ncbi:MAG: hypothetical protein R3A47_05790 [Polyangiales bacterium]
MKEIQRSISNERISFLKRSFAKALFVFSLILCVADAQNASAQRRHPDRMIDSVVFQKFDMQNADRTKLVVNYSIAANQWKDLRLLRQPLLLEVEFLRFDGTTAVTTQAVLQRRGGRVVMDPQTRWKSARLSLNTGNRSDSIGIRFVNAGPFDQVMFSRRRDDRPDVNAQNRPSAPPIVVSTSTDPATIHADSELIRLCQSSYPTTHIRRCIEFGKRGGPQAQAVLKRCDSLMSSGDAKIECAEATVGATYNPEELVSKCSFRFSTEPAKITCINAMARTAYDPEPVINACTYRFSSENAQLACLQTVRQQRTSPVEAIKSCTTMGSSDAHNLACLEAVFPRTRAK